MVGHAANHESEEQSVAVIGMALRVPGADSLSGFWRTWCGDASAARAFRTASCPPGCTRTSVRRRAMLPYRYSIEGTICSMPSSSGFPPGKPG